MEDAGDGDKPKPEPPTAESATSTASPAAQQVDGQEVEDKTPPLELGPGGPFELSGVAPKEDAKPITNAVEQVPADELFSNPLNKEIYQDSSLEPLTLSIKDDGVLSTLTARWVDGKRQLIGGHRRREAAKLAGLTHVPVLMVEVKDERTGAQRSVQDNVGAREKTNEERIREYAILKPKEAAAAKTRQKRAGAKKGGKKSAPPAEDVVGKAADIAAKKVGLSRPSTVRSWTANADASRWTPRTCSRSLGLAAGAGSGRFEGMVARRKRTCMQSRAAAQSQAELGEKSFAFVGELSSTSR